MLLTNLAMYRSIYNENKTNLTDMKFGNVLYVPMPIRQNYDRRIDSFAVNYTSNIIPSKILFIFFDSTFLSAFIQSFFLFFF